MKKCVSLLMAVVLLFSLAVPAMAAGAATLTLTTDKETVAPGETVTVKVSIDTEVTNLMCFGYRVYFNADLLEITNRTVGAATDKTTIGGTDTDNIGTYVVINALDTNGLAWTLSAGTIAEIEFTAKEGASGNANFKLYEEVALIDYDTFGEVQESVIVNPEKDVTVGNTLYAVTVPETTNGTVTADKATAAEGETVTLTVTPAEGYRLGSLTATDANGAAITVTNNTFAMPASNVTVAAAFEKISNGYTVTMPADFTMVAGETANVDVVVENADSSANYNAFDMSFAYDASILKLTSTEIEGMTVTPGNGTVRVQRYGDDLTVGSAAFTLTFEAIGTGETTVTATSAKVGIAESAHELDAADAAILDDATVITISSYAVTLPEDFTGESTVAPGENYTFEAKNKNYNYTVTAKVGDTVIPVTDNGNGTFTIPANQITGSIVITSSKEGKTFDVALGDDMTGAASAQYMTPYTATLAKVEGYTYDIKVTIGDNDNYTGFSYDEATGVVTIPGADITGAIVFNSNKTKVEPSEYTVTFEGNGAGDVAEGTASKVTAGADYSFALNKAEGYTYTVSYKMGDSTESVALTEADGKYTIGAVSGNLVITIEKESDLTVEVSEYVQLDGKAVFLVRATGTLAEGKAYAYSGDTMYYSNVYNAWSFLVIVDEGNTFTADDAKAKIAAVEAEHITLEQNFDVNMSKAVDINDAQLVYNIYKCEYADFSVANMQKFLYADTNGDMVVDTLDAAAIVSEIVKAK